MPLSSEYVFMYVCICVCGYLYQNIYICGYGYRYENDFSGFDIRTLLQVCGFILSQWIQLMIVALASECMLTVKSVNPNTCHINKITHFHFFRQNLTFLYESKVNQSTYTFICIQWKIDVWYSIKGNTAMLKRTKFSLVRVVRYPHIW